MTSLDYRAKPGFETKRIPFYVKEIDEDRGIVTHIVAVMGNVDDGGDRIQKGAFAKTIAERGGRIRALDQHRTDSVTRVVGKPLEMKEIGREELPGQILQRAPEATGGLLVTTKFALETQNGRDTFNLIKGGFVPESSIGYDTIQSEFIEEKSPSGEERTVRVLKEIRLWEYSSVIWGMNPVTATISAKADGGEKMEKGEKDTSDATFNVAGLTTNGGNFSYTVPSSTWTPAEGGNWKDTFEVDVDHLPDYGSYYVTIEIAGNGESEDAAGNLEKQIDSADEGDESKNDLKAGRVLSQQTIAKIESAISELQELLQAAQARQESDETGEEDLQEQMQSDGASESDTPEAKILAVLEKINPELATHFASVLEKTNAAINDAEDETEAGSNQEDSPTEDGRKQKLLHMLELEESFNQVLMEG